MKKSRDRGFRYAVKAACLSGFRSHRVGAALFHKNKLIRMGWNRKKSHPLCPTEHSQHAEFNLCVGLDKLVLSPRCILYVARLTRTGDVGIAKPCEACQDFIRSVGIKRIFYTNQNGQLEEFYEF